MDQTKNIVLFGATGSGKSSIVNMLAGKDIADMSSDAKGCTFKSARYKVNIAGQSYYIYDTAGLNEGAEGTVPQGDALVQLYKLICSLDSGVNLLVFCMRGPRINDSVHRNWRIFYEVFCQKKVPIVISITGMENEDPMDDWWYRNKGAFHQYEMFPFGFACITATKGKRKASGAYALQEEYDESRQKVSNLLRAHSLERAWQVERIEWFTHIVRCWSSYTEEGPAIRQLVTRCEMPEQDARALAQRLHGI